MVKLKGPKDAASVTFEGHEYQVKNGVVEVPDALEGVEDLFDGRRRRRSGRDREEGGEREARRHRLTSGPPRCS